MDPAQEQPPESALGPVPVIERYLEETVGSCGLPDALREAIAYALLGGGKRLRPVLAWHACEAAGTPGVASLPAGAAVELIHAFSLVHDDLPSMDDDEMRRGRPTLHRHAGEAMAVLAGDAMTVLAFRVLAERVADEALCRRLVGELAGASCSMIAGQVHDTLGGFAEGLDAPAKLDLIHRNKTGALIRSACRMGCLCGLAGRGTVDEALLDAATHFGETIGLMFQIVDDLLDVEQSAEHVGKRTRKDAGAGKLTYPGVHGVIVSRQRIHDLEEQAIAFIGRLGPAADPLRDLCRYLARRTA